MVLGRVGDYDPPVTMMGMDALVRAVEGGAVLWASYHDFVFHDRDYKTSLLPRLALPV